MLPRNDIIGLYKYGGFISTLHIYQFDINSIPYYIALSVSTDT